MKIIRSRVEVAYVRMLLFLTPPPSKRSWPTSGDFERRGGEIVRIYGWVPHRANYNSPPLSAFYECVL